MLATCLLGIFPLKSQAGIMVGGTRFIYNEKNVYGISFLIRNTDDLPYLIQTKIMQDNTQGNTSNTGAAIPPQFVATPPLMQLKRKQENYIRIVRAKGMLPKDRESLFQVSVAAIPSGVPKENDVQVALRSRYKLIYRPSGLQGNPNLSYQQLRWQRHGASVTVENPTPYYITLFKLSINGQLQPAEGVVAPFGSRTDNWCPKSGKCNLGWQSLNDWGDPTPEWTIIPQTVANLGVAKLAKANVSSQVSPEK